MEYFELIELGEKTFGVSFPIEYDEFCKVAESQVMKNPNLGLIYSSLEAQKNNTMFFIPKLEFLLVETEPCWACTATGEIVEIYKGREVNRYTCDVCKGQKKVKRNIQVKSTIGI